MPEYKQVRNSPAVCIAGSGPAGLFAALTLLQQGIKPVLFERGKDVRNRRRDLAFLNRGGILNPDSNYCFGEGGAGTYSDGKLYTRSGKRGDVRSVLHTFVAFGADPDILIDAHPHIGTNKLPGIIQKMREIILHYGGEVYFDHKITDIEIASGSLRSVILNGNAKYPCTHLVLATGHSARDIFHLLHNKNVALHVKPFAMGIRIEHPQELIDSMQYHCSKRNPLLPPASYAIVRNTSKRSAYSFCMCPGGIMAPAATAQGEVVVNGWSPSRRNNPFANSGFVVPVGVEDVAGYAKYGPLAALQFQAEVEQICYISGGGGFKAPAQRMIDFVERKNSVTLPACSYRPGIVSVSLDEVLPGFIAENLREAFSSLKKIMPAFYTNEAVCVAVESRTSSPVSIPRDPGTLEHPQVRGLYPCGEGAGYAGGIVSAAMDGIAVANKIRIKK